MRLDSSQLRGELSAFFNYLSALCTIWSSQREFHSIIKPGSGLHLRRLWCCFLHNIPPLSWLSTRWYVHGSFRPAKLEKSLSAFRGVGDDTQKTSHTRDECCGVWVRVRVCVFVGGWCVHTERNGLVNDFFESGLKGSKAKLRGIWWDLCLNSYLRECHGNLVAGLCAIWCLSVCACVCACAVAGVPCGLSCNQSTIHPGSLPKIDCRQMLPIYQ